MDFTIIFVFSGIIFIGVLLLVVTSIGRGKKTRIDVEKYRVKYLEIENRLKKDDKASYYLSILNADKLLDQALKDLGAKGQTMGERMRSFSKKISDKKGIWEAHKLRNRIAHEQDVVVSYADAVIALKSYKKVLRELGVI